MDCRSSFPKIIAHQGICVNGHTNTIPAFKAAVAAGAEMIEMDVHETRDGHFIVFHDDAFTPETPAWHDLLYTQVLSLTRGDERAPKLFDCVDAIGPVPLDLEIKHCCSVTNLVQQLSTITLAPGSVVSSFNYHLLRQLSASGLRLPLLLLVSLSRRWNPIRNLRNAGLCLMPQLLPSFLDGMAVHYTLAHKTMIRALQRKNKTTFVWTVDNPEKMKKYILMHVDGIITNCPQRLKTLRPLD